MTGSIHLYHPHYTLTGFQPFPVSPLPNAWEAEQLQGLFSGASILQGTLGEKDSMTKQMKSLENAHT